MLSFLPSVLYEYFCNVYFYVWIQMFLNRKCFFSTNLSRKVFTKNTECCTICIIVSCRQWINWLKIKIAGLSQKYETLCLRVTHLWQLSSLTVRKKPKWTSSNQVPGKEETALTQKKKKKSIYIFHALFHAQCLWGLWVVQNVQTTHSQPRSR